MTGAFQTKFTCCQPTQNIVFKTHILYACPVLRWNEYGLEFLILTCINTPTTTLQGLYENSTTKTTEHIKKTTEELNDGTMASLLSIAHRIELAV